VSVFSWQAQKQQQLDEEAKKLDAKVAALGQPMNLEPGLPSLEQMDSSIFIR
jgi:hypothetical protein